MVRLKDEVRRKRKQKEFNWKKSYSKTFDEQTDVFKDLRQPTWISLSQPDVKGNELGNYSVTLSLSPFPSVSL